MSTFPSNAGAFLGMGLADDICPKKLDTKSCSNPPSDSPSPSRQINSRYKNFFQPRKWTLRRAPSLPNSASLTNLLQDSSSLELSGAAKQVRKDLEDLTAATWNRDKRIALLDLSEIKVQVPADNDARICNVESITLEKTAEYLQQEGYRLQLHNKSKEQLYSLKRIPPSKLNSTSSNSTGRTRRKGLRLLVQEATILTKLGEHPNIVSLRALPFPSCPINGFFLLTDRLHPDNLEMRILQWQKEGRAAFANHSSWDPYVELYNGGDDDTIATPNDDMIPRKTNYALQIAKALQACHKAGIVVRDLSPQTIGFRHDDPHCIQIVDLGHAQEEVPLDNNADPKTSSLVGKRRYLAGEIWKTGRYSKATDVYSWAMIYYEMCMERKPFLGYSVNEHQKYVWEKGDRPLLASCYLPQGIDQVMMRAWAHRPEERWTIDEVCHQTQTLLMHLDSCLFWDQCAEGEFLFDVLVSTNDENEEDTISELGDRMEVEVEQKDELLEVESILLEQQDELSACNDDDVSSCGSEEPQQGSFTAKQNKLISSAA